MEHEMADQRVFITRTRPRWRPDRGGDPSRTPRPPPGRAPRPTAPRRPRPSRPTTSISRAWFRTPCKRHHATRTDLRPTPCGPRRVIECRPRCCRRRPIVPWPETFVSTRGDDGGFAGTALYPPRAASRSVQHRRPRNAASPCLVPRRCLSPGSFCLRPGRAHWLALGYLFPFFSFYIYLPLYLNIYA